MRIAVADDGGLFRDGLVMLLGAIGHEVVGCVPDGRAIVDLLDETPADVAVLDIRMPPEPHGGLDAARRLRTEHPDLGLLLLSQYAETDYLNRMLEIGTEAIGYRLKEKIGSVAALGDTLNRIAAGELVIEPALAARLVNRSSDRGSSELAALSDREIEVLRLMAEGRSNAGIAAQLYVSVKAVEKHSASIFAKLGLTDDGGSHHRRVLAVLTYLRAHRPVS
jgi:DNA-binding NarL/FixJ family response regulator